jgi:leucyl-tRNA synthetase
MTTSPMTLDWPKVQDKWQKKWKDLGKATTQKKDKFMIIFAYPGISGYPHVGHMRGYSYTDAIARFERLQGKEVLFPVGTHASGNQAISFANKVKNDDKEWIEYLLRNGCPKDKIKELTSAENIIEYFNQVYVDDYWKKFGFICDWDRFTCTTYPDYEKFMQWQFKKLQKQNLLVQKPYFATACIKCGPVAVDPSETDISKGGNAEKNEYTLLKFTWGDDFLVAATLRPETIYGQTNLWINPDADYVRVEVEGENWVMSKEAAEKLSYQKDDVMLKEDMDVTKLIGRKVHAPGINRELPIFPASFCDPNVGTGIVTSVPSDAPFDYVALTELQNDEETCQRYGLDFEEVKSVRLIPIIHSKGYGKFPAKEIVEKMEISSLDDPKLVEATKEIYKAGFHTGIMAETCDKYVGKRVEEAKELVKAELLEEGYADRFHDLSEEVICRCGSKVIIKRIDDQWFIRYSDPELTERSKEHVKEMKVFPKEYGEHLPGILDWFQDRACARLGNWSGSKFPFDDRWTIEPISDSTLYPTYYIVSKFVNNGTFKVEDLTEEFFDYVFLGEGKGKPEWKDVRSEFDYFYPLDLNLGGKEHKTVHFPVFLMNHVGILHEEKWPGGIFVNWWVTGKGSKISKSKGGAEPIPEAMEKYGVDAMRLYYAHIGSPHVDVIWDEPVVLNYRNALERIYTLVEDLKKLDGKSSKVDDWLISRVNQHVRKVNENMKEYDLRELASSVYYTIYDDLRWYLRRGGNNKKTISEVVNTWCKLMNPITPHLSEEINYGKGLISVSSWPEVGEVDLNAQAGEELVKVAMDGMRKVLELAKLEKANKFTLFIAQDWLYELYTNLSAEMKVTRNVGEVMKKILENDSLKVKGKEITKIVSSSLKDPSRLPHIVTTQEDEFLVMNGAVSFLKKEFGCNIEVIVAERSKHPKANSAMPGKVGVLVE